MKRCALEINNLAILFISMTLMQYGCDKTDETNTSNQVVAAFSANQTFINPGYSVQFTDQSTNMPISWMWMFGDGDSSISQNPSHTFSTVGTYTVSLKASNSNGSDTETKNDYLNVIALRDSGTVTDFDDNTYRTVQIGDQWWMAENLRTTHFNNGKEIRLVESNSDWNNLGFNDKAYSYYNNTSTNANTYDVLYTWGAAMNGAESTEDVPSNVQGACPDGWHLPCDVEWMVLEMYLGMSYEDAWDFGWRGTNEGNKLKTTSGWYNDGNGNNSSGFSALPAGTRNSNGSFIDMGMSTQFWTSTEYVNNSTCAWNRKLDYAISGIGQFRGSHFYGFPKDFGFSVRCVKN